MYLDTCYKCGHPSHREVFVYRKPAISCFFCLASILSTTALGQGVGTIHGTVTDASGKSIPKAKVTAVLEDRGATRTIETDDQGGYVFPSLPVGRWEVRVEAAGFKIFSQSGVELSSNGNARVDGKLEVGNLSQSIAVVAEAPLVDSRSSTVGTLIDSRRVVELPINGRNIIALAGLLPGASQVSAPQTFTGDRSGPTLSISGSRGNENLFLFDGAEYNAAFPQYRTELSASRRVAGSECPDQQLHCGIRPQCGLGAERGNAL